MNEEQIDIIKQVLEDIKYTPTFRFALIGSRATNEETKDYLYDLSIRLLSLGAQGYSGGAEGADEQLTKAVKELIKLKMPTPGYRLAKIFIGWYKFNGLIGGELDGAIIDGSKVSSVPQATVLARQLHPAFDKMKPGARALHTRNCFQILDESLSNPVDAVFYATESISPYGEPMGGTATAWRLAEALGIPTFNCAVKDGRRDAEEWILERLAGDKEKIDIFNMKRPDEMPVVIKPRTVTTPSTVDNWEDEDIQF